MAEQVGSAPVPTGEAGIAPRSRRRLMLVAACFALSGAASLMDQVVWLRLLGLIFGNTTFAAATLLAVFLGGLGLGALAGGRLADRLTRPLWAYAAVEVVIAALALTSPFALELVSSGYVAVYRNFGAEPVLFALARTALAAAALLPPTLLMGCTLPLLLAAVARGDAEGTATSSTPRRSVGFATAVLYATNTLGAMAGVALAGFVTIRLLGLTATLEIAAGLNMVAALGCYLLGRRTTAAKPSPAASASQVADPAVPGSKSPTISRRSLLALFFAMGATSLAYEVLWTRILVFYLGSSVYAFSLMLLIFLLGIGLGSLFTTWLAARWPGDSGADLGSTTPISSARTTTLLLLLAGIELTLGFWAAVQVDLFARLNDWLGATAQALGVASWGGVVVAQFLALLPLLLPPTLLMGISFPLAVALLARDPRRIGRDVGAVYGANTVGSVLGALATGFLLVPVLGTQNGLLAVGIVNLAIAGWIVWKGIVSPDSGVAPKRRAVLGTVAVAGIFGLAALALRLPPDRVILAAGIFSDDAPGDLMYFAENSSAAVTVRNRHAEEGRYRSLELNGVNVAGTSPDLYAVQKMQGHLPLLLAGRREEVVHIGFGSGGTAHAVTRHPVHNVLIVEISAAVLQASARFFPDINHAVLTDPRVASEINDGRNFLLASERQFDAVLSDSIHPRYAGNGSLYSREYFALAKARLRPGGVVSMWLPTYALSTRNFAMILAAFAAEFPHTTVWYEPSALNPFTIVTGSLAEAPWNAATLDAAFADPQVASELTDLGISGPADVLLCYLAGGAELRQWLADFPAHIDDIPAVEYESGRLVGRDLTWLETFTTLLALRPAAPPADYLLALPPPERERAAAAWPARGKLLTSHRDVLAHRLVAAARAR